MPRKHRLISIALYTLGFGATFLVLFGFVGAYWPLADSVAHFRFHLVALAILAAMGMLGLRQWRTASVYGIAGVAGLIGMTPAVPTWSGQPELRGGQAFTLAQLNVSFENSKLESVAELVRREGADLVTLQELTERTARIVGLLSPDYPYHVVCGSWGVGGVAVMSRFPLAAGESRACVEKRRLTWLRVMVHGRPISVASLHLHWPYPYGQVRQLDQLEGQLARIPRPVLVAGDFNAAPWSHSVHRVAVATDTRVAEGLRMTFAVRLKDWLPKLSVPIDHVLLPRAVSSVKIRATPGPGSDHAALVAKVALP